MLHLEKENFNDVIKEGKYLVDFYAEWCGPCKMMGPVLEKLEDKINVVKVNVDEHEDLAREYGIMSIPTLIFFENGEIVKQLVGFHNEDDLKNIIDNM